MKNTLILMAFFISACGGQVSALSQSTDTEYRTPQPTATQSPVPTPTIEYQATAHVAETQVAIAQATADEANRIMVQATNDEAQRQHEASMQNAQATAQAESNAMVQYGWTATAAFTSVPLTATAQIDNATAIAAYNTMTIAQITATAHAPTQVVADANARTQAQFSTVFAWVQVFALFSLGVFMLFTAWFMRWYWMREDARALARSPQGVAERHGYKPIPQVVPEPDPEPVFTQPVAPDEMVITVRKDYGDGNVNMSKYTVPCTHEQLLQVAENVLTKGWTLAINQWESAETRFTRNTFSKLRSWLQSNQFAVSAGSGTLALSPTGRTFLEAFLNANQLPTEYEFGEMAVAQ